MAKEAEKLKDKSRWITHIHTFASKNRNRNRNQKRGSKPGVGVICG